MRSLLAALQLGLLSCAFAASTFAAAPPSIDVQILSADSTDPGESAVISGSLDDHFVPFNPRSQRLATGVHWLRLQVSSESAGGSVPALMQRAGEKLRIQLFTAAEPRGVPLPAAVELPAYRAFHDAVYVLPSQPGPRISLYERVEVLGVPRELRVSVASFDQIVRGAAGRERMIALAFGALMCMALAALLSWFVLSDKLLILCAGLLSMQALYLVYISGHGFHWPLLSLAQPLRAYAWNVPVALAGAMACLFVREIADLRRFSPRIYSIFGWLAVVFVVLSVANLARHIGLESVVVASGNVVFLGSAVFTAVVAFAAWRRGNRAAGWFLVAWGLLEIVTIASSVQLLITDGEDAEALLFYGEPFAMMASAVLIALGLADRLREQRLAHSEAEHRAQTDPLTGVLNRGSLIERLDETCLCARSAGLPIALLFIDLDHFKEINDSRGHPAGDACLRAIVGPIQAELRQSDVVGRYGGEEFVVILTGADAAAAHPIAERILKRVAAVCVEGFGEPIRLTCSIGVAASDTLGVWGEHLIAHADAAVYAAKRQGRNCVQVAPLAA